MLYYSEAGSASTAHGRCRLCLSAGGELAPRGSDSLGDFRDLIPYISS